MEFVTEAICGLRLVRTPSWPTILVMNDNWLPMFVRTVI